jgi:hypothetical protein
MAIARRKASGLGTYFDRPLRRLVMDFSNNPEQIYRQVVRLAQPISAAFRRYDMPSTSGPTSSKNAGKSGTAKTASSKGSASAKTSGKQGGSPEQHAEAGKQSHKNSK